VFVGGDLSKLDVKERLSFYNALCKSLNLNPLTRPFEYITLQGKMTLYARKDATEQLRKINVISIEKMEEKVSSDIYRIQVTVVDSSGRKDIATGAVNISGLKGDALANAYMKAETKAKRRATLSICGLGFLDETELETIPEIKTVKGSSPKVIQKDNKKSGSYFEVNWVSAIDGCKSLEELEHTFKAAYKDVMNKKDKDLLSQIISIKDLRKKELEADKKYCEDYLASGEASEPV
jgi:hypothetical protein